MEILFLVGKVLFGGYFIYSGFNHFFGSKMLVGYAKSKNVPMPAVAVPVSGVMMILGGLGVLFGVYLKWSLLLLVIFLLVASFMMHNFWNDKDTAMRMSNTVNFFKNIALLGASLMMMSL